LLLLTSKLLADQFIIIISGVWKSVWVNERIKLKTFWSLYNLGRLRLAQPKLHLTLISMTI